VVERVNFLRSCGPVFGRQVNLAICEIKRRTRAIGAFPDRASALRLITAVALQVTSIWSDRLYLDMSLLTNHHATAA
jgi:transposase-like protein